MGNTELIQIEGAVVEVKAKDNGVFDLCVLPEPGYARPATQSVSTSYPMELIQRIISLKGIWVCDEIARETNPDYVDADLRFAVLSYLKDDALKGKTLLDFGCGSGSSTCILSRMFPDANIVGVDMAADLLEVASMRAEFYGLTNVRFVASSNPRGLPPEIGEVDAISMTGVYEHLLPEERPLIMRALWEKLSNNGYLFLHQTPHRFFPIETHTTGGLPLINYLPKALAFPYARIATRRGGLRNDSWETLLRKGLRGGTRRGVIKDIGQTYSSVKVLSPVSEGLRDSIDLWYQSANRGIRGGQKTATYRFCRILRSVFGIELPPYLSLAIQKTTSDV